MNRFALGVSLPLAGLFVVLAFHDPLAAASLTPAQRAAGWRSVELSVAGENCRFCRINVERLLKAVTGVKIAKADMAHHRARVIYDPALVSPDALQGVVQAPPSSPEGLP